MMKAIMVATAARTALTGPKRAPTARVMAAPGTNTVARSQRATSQSFSFQETLMVTWISPLASANETVKLRSTRMSEPPTGHLSTALMVAVETGPVGNQMVAGS